MGLRYDHLDEASVRRQIVVLWTAELALLEARYPIDDWPYGKLLTADGLAALKATMPVALELHDDDWLTNEMQVPAYWQEVQLRRKPKGGYTEVEYDRDDALRRLTVGEFNTAYVRGVAAEVIARGEQVCRVYRAGEAAEPRRAYCSDLEGSPVEAQQVLDDHRANYWPERRSGARPIPSGPNCHHSVRFAD